MAEQYNDVPLPLSPDAPREDKESYYARVLGFVAECHKEAELGVKNCEGWSKIVRKGGIVSGHDYGHFKHKDRNLGTKRAIDEYVAEHKVKLFLVNRNFQTSWFFIK